ncbi:MAG: cadmium transporter [Actinobacteria bacterium 69-20]|nr:cadmium resistance transporter [Actinomycetota bacterium]OJV26276.1 MAG: cadmium transporter [Actinobacteria bacterium 69-20]
MGWLWQAIVLFAVTNVDDIVVLSLFFGRAGRAAGSTRRIVAGQYLGFGLILAVSIAGAFGAGQLPDHAAAYLGLIPIALGLYAAYGTWRHHRGDTPNPAPRGSVWSVAGVTLANGGDNIGVYIPALAAFSTPKLGAVAAVFLVLVAVWCLAGYLLTSHRWATAAMQRWGHIIHPFALITIGMIVLISGGAFGL